MTSDDYAKMKKLEGACNDAYVEIAWFLRDDTKGCSCETCTRQRQVLEKLRDALRPAQSKKTIANNRDVVVTITPGLNAYTIEDIQTIEKALDESLGKHGFQRSKTNKSSEQVELIYFAFMTA